MRIFFPIAAAVVALAACAEKAPQVSVTDPTIVPTPMGAAGYFTLTNAGGSDRLVTVDIPSMGPAMIHETTMTDGVMRMRHVDGVAVPAGETVAFRRGGYHVMIAASATPPKAGATVAMVLHFAKQGDVTVNAKVEAPAAPTAMEGM
jgi:copper(I)-binding protein